MGDIKYLFKRIIYIDYKNMFVIAKSISKKIGKNYLFIILDMIKSGLLYEAGYYDYQEFEFYNLNKEERRTYLTRGKNNKIVKTFNKKSSFYKFENKVEFNKIFNPYLKRDWMFIDHNENDFVKFIKAHINIIVKPVNGEGGQGIERFSFSDEVSAKKLYNQLINNNQLLIEEYINQHDDMNLLYNNSVNTLRIFTFYKDNQAYFLQAILKIGNGKVVDNFSSGGMYTYVNSDGYVYVEAIDRNDNIYNVHPISGSKIVGFKIPMFQEAIDMVKSAAAVVPEIAYAGWDVAISKNGPVIVEGNCFPGIYQVKPSLTSKKEGLVPKYNEIMHIFKRQA